jgi:hypothetical protein
MTLQWTSRGVSRIMPTDFQDVQDRTVQTHANISTITNCPKMLCHSVHSLGKVSNSTSPLEMDRVITWEKAWKLDKIWKWPIHKNFSAASIRLLVKITFTAEEWTSDSGSQSSQQLTQISMPRWRRSVEGACRNGSWVPMSVGTNSLKVLSVLTNAANW